MTKDPALITVPTFTFNQGDIFLGEGNAERPIQVNYYSGSIELVQEGEYEDAGRIAILPEHLDKLFKAIKKHQKDAEFFLNKK